jgi:hypothetical protein
MGIKTKAPGDKRYKYKKNKSYDIDSRTNPIELGNI